jgi:hypothetical protein
MDLKIQKTTLAEKTIHALDRSGSGGGVMYIILNNMEGCRS